MSRSWFKTRSRGSNSSFVSDAPTPRADGSLIRLSGLTKNFETPAGTVTALRHVELDVRPHEFVAVIGKSGSGKSTLINMITGIDRPTSGEIVVCGTPIHLLDESRLAVWRGRNMGVIFQFFQLLPTLTLIENVMLPMELARLYTPRQRRARAMDLLEQVGLADYGSRLPMAVSGGQQQRAAIARALANDPPVLVADEPTGSLDPRTAADMFHLFERFVAQGKTMLLVTHDRDLAARVNRVVLIAEGEIMDQVIAQALPFLSEQELVALTARLDSMTFPPGAVIVRQGEMAGRFFIVLKGETEVVLEGDDGHETIIDRRRSGEFFGEAGLLAAGERTATVRAALNTTTVVVALDRENFARTMAGSTPTREEITRVMREHLLRAQASTGVGGNHA